MTFFRLLSISLFIFSIFAYAQDLSESQVFEWWDDDIITPEEALEILNLLETENKEEACILAETYANEPCTLKSKEIKNTINLTPNGYVSYKAHFDSIGHLESHREELEINFYRYKLRLGSQELLTYKNNGSESYFGEISTKELHSFIPLDTLWGTSFVYPLNNVRVSATLDTTLSTQARIQYIIKKNLFFDAIYWENRFSQNAFQSIAFQANIPYGKIASWWQFNQSQPLIKITLQSKDTPSKKNQKNLFWNYKNTIYIHGDSIPHYANISASIAKNQFWNNQILAATIPSAARTIISSTIRIQKPLHQDSLSTRIKTAVQSGPNVFRAKAHITCIEAIENCENLDWKVGFSSELSKHWALASSYSPSKTNLSIQYNDSPQNFFRINFIIPNKEMPQKMQIRPEVHLCDDIFNILLITTFKNTRNKILAPSHAYFAAKISF